MDEDLVKLFLDDAIDEGVVLAARLAEKMAASKEAQSMTGQKALLLFAAGLRVQCGLHRSAPNSGN